MNLFEKKIVKKNIFVQFEKFEEKFSYCLNFLV